MATGASIKDDEEVNETCTKDNKGWSDNRLLVSLIKGWIRMHSNS